MAYRRNFEIYTAFSLFAGISGPIVFLISQEDQLEKAFNRMSKAQGRHICRATNLLEIVSLKMKRVPNGTLGLSLEL